MQDEKVIVALSTLVSTIRAGAAAQSAVASGNEK